WMRGRYLNLFADSKGGGVQVNVATGPREPMKVAFVRSPYTNEPMPSAYDLGSSEYRELPPPADIPLAPPRSGPIYISSLSSGNPSRHRGSNRALNWIWQMANGAG